MGGTLTRPVAVALVVLACVAPWGILFGTNTLLSDPDTAWRPHRCTRHCHDHNCRHEPVLPAWLTSDEGLYGRTIDGLYVAGGWTGLGAAEGYGVANLVLFCALWPAGMLGLLALGLWQRVWLRERRRGR